ncbi:MAG: integrase arm-type DNA-binding domain-containing protein [Alphaproteobacteria bacterium]|nr:integrase arm-type DNA-binding domain-containing protein [Alphaproteobacteria bacterium]
MFFFSQKICNWGTNAATGASPAATGAGRKRMANVTLTEARVKALQPRKTVRDVRDGKLRGFGVWVLPSGRKRYFIQCQHRGERIWKIVGDGGSMSVKEARASASEVLAAVRRGEEAPGRPDDSLFENVAETVLQSYGRVWKPGTLYANQHYLKNQIMPYFATCEIGDIARRDVRNWFASLRATPSAADRSMPILSVIMREAEKMGLRPEGSNPCRGIKRYRRKGRERFLSEDEIRRLSVRLSARAKRYPLQVAVIRLLLLTGCRKSEILTLRWSGYREGNLFLRDSKTGPPDGMAVAAGP